MTEAEWDGCGSARAMLAFVHAGRVSSRKLRLFAVTCARDLLEHDPATHAPEEWGGSQALESAILRAEADADGQGPPLPPYSFETIWVAHPDAATAAP